MDLIIYTDGSCSINNASGIKPGGWAYWIQKRSEKKLSGIRRRGEFKSTTCNEMELVAVVKSLEFCSKTKRYGLKNNINIFVITDSKYVFNVYNGIESYIERGWKTKKGKVAANIKHWKRLLELVPEFKSFRVQWIKGHSDCKGNNIADGLARKSMKSMKRKLDNQI